MKGWRHILNLIDRKVPRKPRLVSGVKGHNIYEYYITGKLRPVASELHNCKVKNEKCKVGKKVLMILQFSIHILHFAMQFSPSIVG
jgi:hypothetical protein